MSTRLADRVRTRIEALRTNPFEIARRAGFERSFVNDLLIGKKRSIREDRLAAIADQLECDVAYLMGHQDTPRIEAATEPGQPVPVVGACELGVWRGQPPIRMDDAPVTPDPRFPDVPQLAYFVRGTEADGIGITDGMIVIAISAGGDAPQIRDGDAVVVRRTRPGGEFEISIRKVERGPGGAIRLVVVSSTVSGPVISPADEGVEILGIIVRAIRVFGYRN